MGRQAQGRNSYIARRLGLWLGLTLACYTTAAPTPFPPPQSTVILLAGLPGDIESETTYRDQLRSWVELLQGSGRVQKLFVLCDSPESLGLPASTNGGGDGSSPTVLKGNRSTFLDLSQTLAGKTNPLVVVAWGHGGQQGANPVFHVRGPRLAPADFAQFAAKVPAAESDWVLMFRGSGAFGAALAGNNRQVLASEGDTVFSSDPVGMGILLKLLRTQTAAPFAALAEEFGRATAAWYAERKLARTEEPTLWQDEQKPRALARGAGTEIAAGGTATEQLEKPATNQVAEPQTISGELPPTWKGITKVDPGKYPDVDGIVLRRRLSYTLGSNPAVASEQDEFIQILTPEGKRFGDFDISYSPPFEEINFLDCEVLRPDGTLTRLDPDAIKELVEPSLGDYQFGRRKFFSLPGVEPGAVLHVRYRTQWKKFPLPEISMELPVASEMPALDATVEVSVSKKTAFHFAAEHVTAPDPAVSQSSYGSTYTWHFDYLPARSQEVLSAPSQRPRLMVSTFADWATFAEWYDRITQLTDEATPEITAKAQELTRGAGTDREKVLALYNYVTRLRYVAVPLGVNSVRPHAAARVFQNQFGDCKDKANLLNTMLHSLHIPAHLVLVPRFGQAYEAVPGLAFNHAISRVLLDGKPLWVDTTDEVCRFGMLPPGDPGRRVLVMDGQGASLTQLPPPQPAQHQLKLQGKLTCLNPGDALPVSLSATATGISDYELRQAAGDARNLKHSLPLLATDYRPVAGSFAMEKQSATRVSALDEDFSWRAEGTAIGLSTVRGRNWVLHAPFWVPEEWDQALQHRQSPLFLNQGYPLTLEQEFSFTLPPEAQPASVPGAREGTTEPLRWKIEWQQTAPNQLTARLRAELVRGELSAEETPRLQEQLRQLLAALAADAELPLPASFQNKPLENQLQPTGR